VAGKLSTSTCKFDPDDWTAVTLPDTGWVAGKLDTAIVPLTGCVAGKLSTSTCKLDPDDWTAVTLPDTGWVAGKFVTCVF
jgi:hypothetical protein